jgi:phosphoribosyl 1,2-cyclic phosphate phosphodiesterase
VSAVALRILGSGTSQGVPAIGCDCPTCRSDDPRDRRLRPSALFSVSGRALLVDLSADFRQQMLAHDIRRIDAVLMTHHHFDHIGGFDDLRQYNYLQGGSMRIFGLRETLDEMRHTFRYAFGGAVQTGGGLPSAELIEIEGDRPFEVDGVTVQPVPVKHGVLDILGYRVDGVAYLTDVSAIPDASRPLLRGLDALVLNALRHRPHPTHLHLDAAIAEARRIGARRTWFTHIAHNILHARDAALLPEDMDFSYDGQMIQTGMSAA